MPIYLPLLDGARTHGFLQSKQHLPCSSGFSLVSAVLNDIISTMFNRKFMEELFKPQELYSKKALRTVYDRLAHASIMRLNQASMDKVSRQPLCELRCHLPTCRGWSWVGSDRIPTAAMSWEKQGRVVTSCSRLSGGANLRRRLHSPHLLCFTCSKRALLLSPHLWV